eukprot:5602469-Pleurochrysis_carterae.AAC.2
MTLCICTLAYVRMLASLRIGREWLSDMRIAVLFASISACRSVDGIRRCAYLTLTICMCAYSCLDPYCARLCAGYAPRGACIDVDLVHL